MLNPLAVSPFQTTAIICFRDRGSRSASARYRRYLCRCLKDVEAALGAWAGRRVEIVSLKPDSLADIWEDITKVARALERERRGERLMKQLKAHGQNHQAKRRSASAPARRPPTFSLISMGLACSPDVFWR